MHVIIMVRIHLVTFSSDTKEFPVKNFKRALYDGHIDVLSVWDMHRIRATQFYKDHPDIFSQAKGCGYWIWKPLIILHELQNLPPGDVLIYNDAGRNRDAFFYDYTITKRPHIFEGLMPFHQDFIAYAWGDILQHWCKRDVFLTMNADTPEYHSAPKVAGFFAMRKTETTLRLVTEWLHWCAESAVLEQTDSEGQIVKQSSYLITDTPNILSPNENHAGFKGHRHDLSILSILLKRYGIQPRTGYLFYMNRFIDAVVELEEWTAVLKEHPTPDLLRTALVKLNGIGVNNRAEGIHSAWILFAILLERHQIIYHRAGIAAQPMLLIYYLCRCMLEQAIYNFDGSRNLILVRRYIEQIGKYMDLLDMDGQRCIQEFKTVFFKFVYDLMGSTEQYIMQSSNQYLGLLSS